MGQFNRDYVVGDAVRGIFGSIFTLIVSICMFLWALYELEIFIFIFAVLFLLLGIMGLIWSIWLLKRAYEDENE